MIDFDADPTPTPAFARRAGIPFGFWAALAVLILLNGFSVLRWTALDTRPLAWDEAIHTENTFTYRDRLTQGSLSELMKPAYFNYPPLYNLTMVPFLHARADIADAGSAVNVIYLGALVVAVFLIGCTLMDAWSGLAAAMLIGFYPLIIMMARLTMLDLALTTWVAWGFYALIRSENFARSGWSAMFGALLGLGMLTKWTAFLYLAGPAAVSLALAARDRNFRGVVIAALVAAVVMSPWYATNLVPSVARVTHTKDNPPAGGLILHGWAQLFWYPIGLFEELNALFLFLFVAGLAMALDRPALRPVLLWFFVSIALFTVIHNKNTRYALPALPAVAILSASWVRNRRGRFNVIAAVALLFFVIFNFVTPGSVTANVAGARLAYFESQPPVAQDWKHREIVEAVKLHRDPNAPFTLVTVVSNAPYFHSTTLNVSARTLGADHFSFRGVSKNRWLDFSEFILLKTGDVGPDFTTQTVRDDVAWLANPPAWFKTVYKETGRWPLPDGSEAVLFHAEPEPQTVSENEFFTVQLGEVSLPRILATGVDIQAVPITTTETARGRLASVSIRCSSITYQGIAVSSVALTLDGPQINLPRYRADNDLQLLSLRQLSVHGTIRASTILDYARNKLKWLKDPQVTFDGDRVHVSGQAGPLPVEIVARLELAPDWLKPRLERLSVHGVPLPPFLFRALTDKPLALAPNDDWPFRIDLGKIDGQGDVLKVGL